MSVNLSDAEREYVGEPSRFARHRRGTKRGRFAYSRLS